MKPFDLQAAMRGEPIVSRDGEPVQFIAYVPGADPQQQLVTLRAGIVSVTGIGGIYWGSGSESSRDLFMAPCNKDAQHEIAALQARVQELERMALAALRERNARRVIELEAQLEAIGVESLRKRCLHQISEPVNAGWCNGCNPDNCGGCGSAKAAPVGMEPVARIRYERNTPGRENEMPRVVSCNRMADGVYEVFTTSQVQAMLTAATAEKK